MSFVEDLIALRMLKMVASPFKEFDAYKQGVINDKGEIIVKKKDRSYKQKQTMGRFVVIAINLKRLINKLGGENKVKNLLSAAYLFMESTKAQKAMLSENANVNKLRRQITSLPISENNANIKNPIKTMIKSISKHVTNKTDKRLVEAYVKKFDEEVTNCTANIANIDKPLCQSPKNKAIVRRQIVGDQTNLVDVDDIIEDEDDEDLED